jgi:hypothetical protein
MKFLNWLKPLVPYITKILFALTAFQLLIPQLPNINEHTITLVSAITLLLVIGLGALRQFLSADIQTPEALRATLILFITAIVGGVNDFINLVPLSNTVDQWVRFGLTAAMFFVNYYSKSVWPTTIENPKR